jgi:glutathione synthase
MSRQIGVVMDPIETVNYDKDSTLAMLWAAADRDWRLWYMEQGDLYLDGGRTCAAMRPLEVRRDPRDPFSLGAAVMRPLDDLDAVLMRKDPPFDQEFLYSTYLLETAQARGLLVVNDPRSLRDCNEKLYATRFPQCCPPLLVSRDMARLRAFHDAHGDVIFKPLEGMGGTMIFRVREDDPNRNVILETLTNRGRTTVMAQRFIPEIRDGDKRILLIDGEPVPYCLARIPSGGDARGNLAAGGRGEARPLTERDRWIAGEVAADLRARGLVFVGLDVIGDYLTEINVTSPTCIREIDRAFDTDIGGSLMDWIDRRLGP